MNAPASYFVGIGGGTGSGKTTLARAVQDLLGPDLVTIIATDSYYRDLSHIPAVERHLVNFDHPDALDIDLMEAHVRELRRGHTVRMNAYDFTTHCRTQTIAAIEPLQIVIVEGIFALAVEQVSSQLDLKVYIDEHPELRLKRRIRRDVEERGRTAEMSSRQYARHVLPMHARYVEPSKEGADIILSSSADIDRLLPLLREALLRCPDRTDAIHDGRCQSPAHRETCK